MNSLVKELIQPLLEVNKRDYIIYFDIDDTLTNYSNRLKSQTIIDPETNEERPIKASDTVKNLNFWTSAEWLPGSKKMVDFAKNNFSQIEILSTVPELSKAKKAETGERFYKDPIEGKSIWLDKNVGPIKKNWTKSGTEKAIYATPNSVLIDDKLENIIAFQKAGGIGILFDNASNVIKQLQSLKDQIKEMSQSSLQSVEDFADKELAPLDVEFTAHFFDRLNDPRNIKPISPAELIGFFKRLSNKKDQLIDFLKKYKEIVATDNRTNINIPLVKQANSAIAKTIMRKKNFLTSNPKIEFNENINELQSQEIKYWALFSDIFDALKNNPDHMYEVLKNKLTGEKLKALEYFYNEYFINSKNSIEESLNSITFDEALKSLTQYMVDKDMNVEPLPKLIIINNDLENANNILGKTAYYNPNNCSITLYTLNRHPKDILRSYAHEMIHRIQDNEGRLYNINTTNTNEDDELEELEKEAYLKGNMTFRNWEDSLKNSKPVNEVYFLDIEKYNYPRTIHEDLWHTLNEIVLSKDNAVEINGNLTRGKFQVGNIIYEYDIKIIPNPYKDGGNFANISFYPEGNKISIPTSTSTKENYIKILSTMYKIILNFAEEAEPDYIGISSMDNTSNKNYHMVYANLTDNKFNRIPGYFRKDVNLPFETPQEKGKMIVLKRKDV